MTRRGRGAIDATCPMCGQPVKVPQPDHLTDRELDVLSAWWHFGTVRRAAIVVRVGEQRAKNLLYRARQRNQAHSNDELVTMYLDRLRSRRQLLMSHNVRGQEVA